MLLALPVARLANAACLCCWVPFQKLTESRSASAKRMAAYGSSTAVEDWYVVAYSVSPHLPVHLGAMSEANEFEVSLCKGSCCLC